MRSGQAKTYSLAKETPPQGDAIQPANKLLAVPHLDTLRKTMLIEGAIGRHHILAQPGVIIIISVLRNGAIDNHGTKILIECHPVTPTVEQRPHRVGDVNLVRENHKSIQRASPHYRLIPKRKKRKYATPIRINKPLYREVAAVCNQALVVNNLNGRKRLTLNKILKHLSYLRSIISTSLCNSRSKANSLSAMGLFGTNFLTSTVKVSPSLYC